MLKSKRITRRRLNRHVTVNNFDGPICSNCRRQYKYCKIQTGLNTYEKYVCYVRRRNKRSVSKSYEKDKKIT